MSFATEAKTEVLNGKIGDNCCELAYLSAVIKCGGNLVISRQDKHFELFSDLEKLYDVLNIIVRKHYSCNLMLEKTEDVSLKQTKYKIVFPAEITDKLINDLGLMQVGDDDEFDHGIPKFIIDEKCCKQAYVKGVFVVCATSNIVIKKYDNQKKSASGYHLEFVFSYEDTAKDFIELLKEFDINSKLTIRKDSPIVYIKEYQVICDALALVGANKAVLDLQNEAAIREVRNNVNRQTNCLNANLSKTVNASVKQLEAIRTIQNTIGIENLSSNLYELCLLRLANPEESLENLAKLYSEDITKSGINHRFEKLQKIAEKIKKQI